MPISGKEMLKLYLKAGFVIDRQKGSHITVSKGNKKQTIPNHKELHKGTEQDLLKFLEANK